MASNFLRYNPMSAMHLAGAAGYDGGLSTLWFRFMTMTEQVKRLSSHSQLQLYVLLLICLAAYIALTIYISEKVIRLIMACRRRKSRKYGAQEQMHRDSSGNFQKIRTIYSDSDCEDEELDEDQDNETDVTKVNNNNNNVFCKENSVTDLGKEPNTVGLFVNVHSNSSANQLQNKAQAGNQELAAAQYTNHSSILDLESGMANQRQQQRQRSPRRNTLHQRLAKASVASETGGNPNGMERLRMELEQKLQLKGTGSAPSSGTTPAEGAGRSYIVTTHRQRRTTSLAAPSYGNVGKSSSKRSSPKLSLEVPNKQPVSSTRGSRKTSAALRTSPSNVSPVDQWESEKIEVSDHLGDMCLPISESLDEMSRADADGAVPVNGVRQVDQNMRVCHSSATLLLN